MDFFQQFDIYVPPIGIALEDPERLSEQGEETQLKSQPRPKRKRPKKKAIGSPSVTRHDSGVPVKAVTPKKAFGHELRDTNKDQGLYVPHAHANLVPLGPTPTQAEVLIPIVDKAKRLKPRKQKAKVGKVVSQPSDTSMPSTTLNKDNPHRRDLT